MANVHKYEINLLTQASVIVYILISNLNNRYIQEYYAQQS